jgi:hypothetical protein
MTFCIKDIQEKHFGRLHLKSNQQIMHRKNLIRQFDVLIGVRLFFFKVVDVNWILDPEC